MIEDNVPVCSRKMCNQHPQARFSPQDIIEAADEGTEDEADNRAEGLALDDAQEKVAPIMKQLTTGRGSQ